MPEPTPEFSRIGHIPIFWVVQTAVWLLAVLVGTFITVHWELPLQEALSFSLLRAAMGFIATSFLFRPLLRRLRERQARAYWLPVCIFVCAGIVSGLDGSISLKLGALSAAPDVGEKFLWMSILIRWPLYSVWGLLYWLFCEWQDSRETALRLARAEAKQAKTMRDLLRAQIDPHFLLNALNTILGVSDDPKAVVAVTTALSDHLAFSLHRSNGSHTLKTELAAIENYLELEKYRFGADLLFEIEVAAGLMELEVPPGALLLPTENAVKYGRRTSPNPLRIEISGTAQRDLVTLRIANTGHWVDETDAAGLGIGLWNLKKTLAHFGGPRAALRTCSEAGWVQVLIELPMTQASYPSNQPPIYDAFA